MQLGSVSGTANCSALRRRCGPSDGWLKNAFQRLLLRLHSSAASFLGFGLQSRGSCRLMPWLFRIAVQPFLDVGGGCFVRSSVNNQLRPLALEGLIRPA